MIKIKNILQYAGALFIGLFSDNIGLQFINPWVWKNFLIATVIVIVWAILLEEIFQFVKNHKNESNF